MKLALRDIGPNGPQIEHTVSPELSQMLTQAQKAFAFDQVAGFREALREITDNVRRVQKTGKGNKTGIVMAELLGARRAIEEAIEKIFASFEGGEN